VDLQEVVEFAAELFGPDRLMFGSDWPVAELAGGYAKVRAELGRLIDQLPPAGREAVLGGTATRIYQLGTPAGDVGREGR
jgi:L-fuconolactonase